MRYFITLFLYLSLQNITFSSPIKDFTATYDLYHNNFYVGVSTRTLTSENKFLTFTSVSKTAGLAALFFDVTLTETSKLRFKNNRLQFFSYHYDEKKSDGNEDYELRLDKNSTFYNSYKKEYYPLEKELHDTLGFSIAVMHDMQKGKRTIKYTIAEKDSIKTYTLKFVKKENLTTYKGVISTLKMEHYDPQTKYRFTFWCAENMDYLPVRILNINHKGDENLLNLTQFNQKKIYLELDEEEID